MFICRLFGSNPHFESRLDQTLVYKEDIDSLYIQPAACTIKTHKVTAVKATILPLKKRGGGGGGKGKFLKIENENKK